MLARRPGALEQLLCVLERLAQPPAAKLLLDAGPRRLEPRVIPGVAQGRRRGVAHLPHALQQPWPAGKLQQTVERENQRGQEHKLGSLPDRPFFHDPGPAPRTERELQTEAQRRALYPVAVSAGAAAQDAASNSALPLWFETD